MFIKLTCAQHRTFFSLPLLFLSCATCCAWSHMTSMYCTHLSCCCGLGVGGEEGGSSDDRRRRIEMGKKKFGRNTKFPNVSNYAPPSYKWNTRAQHSIRSIFKIRAWEEGDYCMDGGRTKKETERRRGVERPNKIGR